LSDEALREKLGVKRRAKPRELERWHQVALIKWVRTVKDAYPVLDLIYAVPNGGYRTFTSQENSRPKVLEQAWRIYIC
jgi:hypothetical protein